MSLASQIDLLAARIGLEFKNIKKMTTSRLTANVTNSTVTYSSTGLSVTVVSGKTYRIKAMGQYRTDTATTGIWLRLGGTAVETRTHYNITIWGITATTASLRSPTALNGAPAVTTGVASANVDYPWYIDGVIVIGASGGGTITVEFASEVAGSVAQIDQDSYLEVQEIA